jgi:hypothetical protein
MRTYEIVIRSTIDKTITVEAENEEDADEQAHELFDVAYQKEFDERYKQETLSCVEVGK